MNIQRYLAKQHVPFTVQVHRDTFDSQQLAHALHVPGKRVAKAVLLRANHGYTYVVAVLPATHQVDVKRLSDVLGHADLCLATETEMAKFCPDCEFGVVPPFGSQYGLKTIVDESLARDEEIFLQGNTHHEAIRMKYRDFYDLERPLTASFAAPTRGMEGSHSRSGSSST